ncbi:MAG: DUF2851 family protein [Bacteroidales bacterium]|jgi:hypothetical protein|nr:DUF2851 family protein [Bacteroidales bacterium]
MVKKTINNLNQLIMISEKLLHYIWKNQWFRKEKLETVHKQSVSIINQGFLHQDAGPDFKQAIVKIDDVTWAGNIEIHIRSSDWYRHEHQNDIKYNSVVLHVVYEHDREVFVSNGNLLPTLELQNLLSSQLLLRYNQLIHAQYPLPCEVYIKMIEPLTILSFLGRLAFDRISGRETQILKILHYFSEDWEQTLFFVLCQSFGFKTNAPAFEILGKVLPLKILKKHADSHLQVTALIFGQAGMLEEELDDSYYQSLQNEYLYLKAKYRLIPVDGKCWNLLRLRPHNFPCIRLAQLGEIIFNQKDLFAKVTTLQNLDNFHNILVYKPNDYWKTHYYFGKTSRESKKIMGEKSFYLLLINALIPFLYSYSKFKGNEKLQEYSLQLLELLPFEENHITTKYREIGFCARHAGNSQGLLELYHEYCEKKRCIDCGVGQQVILM